MSEPSAETSPTPGVAHGATHGSDPTVPALAPIVPLRAATRVAGALGTTTAAIVFALAMGSTQSLTAPAALLVISAGFAVWVAWFSVSVRSTASWPVARCPGVSVWVLLGALFGAVELAAYFTGDDHHHPTFSRLVNPLFSSPLARAAAGLGWILWGRHLASLVPRAREGIEVDQGADGS